MIIHHEVTIHGAEEALVGVAQEALVGVNDDVLPERAAEGGLRGGLPDAGGAVGSNHVAAALHEAVGSVTAVDAHGHVSIMARGGGWGDCLEFGEKTIEVGAVLVAGGEVASGASVEVAVFL